MLGEKSRAAVRKHSLSLVLTTLWLSFTCATLFLGHAKWKSEGDDIPFWTWWCYEYTMSLVADVFGALALVVLTKRLYEKDSAESTDRPG